MNSFVIRETGTVVTYPERSITFAPNHPQYREIVEALVAGKWDHVAELSDPAYTQGYDVGFKAGQLHSTRFEITGDAVATRVYRVCSDQLGVPLSEIVPTSHFQRDLKADSLDIVELTMAFEDEFNIELTDEDVLECPTVQDVINLINRALRRRM